MTSCSKELRPEPHPKHLLQITTRTLKEPDFKFELLPLHSPLLRQSLLVSFPPLIDMLKFSGYPYLIRGQPKKVGDFGKQPPGNSIARALLRLEPGGTATDFKGCEHANPNTKLGLSGHNDARTGMPLGIPRGAMCVQRFDDSLNSAIHITYRISLRSSSMPEPRDPLLKVLNIIYYSDITKHRVWVLWQALSAEADARRRLAKATKVRYTRLWVLNPFYEKTGLHSLFQ